MQRLAKKPGARSGCANQNWCMKKPFLNIQMLWEWSNATALAHDARVGFLPFAIGEAYCRWPDKLSLLQADILDSSWTRETARERSQRHCKCATLTAQ